MNLLFHLAETSYDYGTTYGTTYSTSADSQLSAVATLIILSVVGILALFLAICFWKIFTKAGKPGWASLVPLYSSYILLQIIGRPGWWLLLLLVPGVNTIVNILIMIDLAKAFGKSTTFGVVGLLLFPFVGYPMLAFGSATYNGGDPLNLSATSPTPPPPGPTSTPPAPPVAPTPPTPPVA